MPELPEVEVVRRGISETVANAKIASVSVKDQRSLRRHQGSAHSFITELEGSVLDAPRRRGKFLWIPVQGTNRALLIHLGMSGQILLTDAPTRHERVRLQFEDGNHLVFNDQRIFGYMAIDDLAEDSPASASHIAHDPLEASFDFQRFFEKASKSSRAVKAVLLDQSVISGVGNIYADESLWRSELHPNIPAHQISKEQYLRLVANIRDVFEAALAEGGTSFDYQYKQTNGESGYFAVSLNAYGQTGKACPRCGSPIQRIKFAGRSSHFCPNCQTFSA
ncbi:MAG: bifunctional DNA-formamidopyrimidine glycosylase/DNA-(apurinic or apyrimidinic site) lyase [Microbacteriaceae bacterium]|nr:bifunctional DNA-formamidopyrimidine glycosylase/DNA-(apurinic or apyrimidinic site) lyase [Microbacteriaceae bacterium]